jgi:hypothetical protein
MLVATSIWQDECVWGKYDKRYHETERGLLRYVLYSHFDCLFPESKIALETIIHLD